jgi:Kef-type K+ transport system membrane component KefB
MSNLQSAILFFLQIAVILLSCRTVGLVARRFGQPQVIAEMVTGILLGPSLFGWLAPDWQAWLFPWDPTQATRDSQSYLFPVSQLGLALYMFLVGMEFRVDVVRRNLTASLAVSLAGIIAPFVLGAGLAWYLHDHTNLFGPTTPSFAAMLFLGASMCITAFPVLARIIQAKGLIDTPVGTVSLGAGAIDDASAWCLLAVVLASIDDHLGRAVRNIAGGVAYVAAVYLFIRPLLNWSARRMTQGERLNDGAFVVCLAVMCLGAWFTDMIGLHAVFGAFVMGTAIPRGVITRDMTTRIQPLAVGLLVPLFFTFSGLNTKIGLLDSWALWGICLAVLAVAIAGKIVACMLAAKWSGVGLRESLCIGILMNTRGLMELIIINIGLERGIISESLFAMLAIMAVVTTLMTSPLFDYVARDLASDESNRDDAKMQSKSIEIASH